MPVKSVVLLAARLLVGGIFIVAAIDKIQAPGAFAEAVRAYHILPYDFSYPFALILPWVEVLAGVYLVTGFLARIGAAAAIGMLAMFVFVLARALITGDTNHSCGCFGQGASPNPLLAYLEGGDTITLWDVIRDALMLGLAGLVLWWGAGQWVVGTLHFTGETPRKAPSGRNSGPDPIPEKPPLP